MECEFETYALRNIFIDFLKGARDTKLFLRAPEIFLIGSLRYNVIDNCRLSLKDGTIYIEGGDRSKLTTELEDRFKRRFKRVCKPIYIEIDDEDIEGIRRYGEQLNRVNNQEELNQIRDNLNEIIEKYEFRR